MPLKLTRFLKAFTGQARGRVSGTGQTVCLATETSVVASGLKCCPHVVSLDTCDGPLWDSSMVCSCFQTTSMLCFLATSMQHIPSVLWTTYLMYTSTFLVIRSRNRALLLARAAMSSICRLVHTPSNKPSTRLVCTCLHARWGEPFSWHVCTLCVLQKRQTQKAAE